MTIDDIDQNVNDLKQIREKKGLSLGEVSDRLKLTKDVIEKLEKSEFKELGVYTYIRGYLKNYASLLDVDSQKYIDLIPKQELEANIINTYSKTNTKFLKFKRQSKGLGSYVVGTFLILAVTLSGWFFLKQYSQTKSRTLDYAANTTLEIRQQSDTERQNGSESSAENNENYHYSSLLPTTTNPKSNAETEVPASENIESLGDEVNESLQSMNAELSNAQGVDEQISGTAVATPNAEANTEEYIIDQYLDAANEANPIQNTGYEIEISTLEDSWVGIKKENGQKLYFDILKPGVTTFQSDQPVHFRIGNKNKVSLKINGEVVDLSKYAKKNIADFNWPFEDS